MTTHKPGTREWAEEQARKGAKVRRIEWDDDQWVTLEHNQGRQRFVNSEGNGWLNWAWPDGRWLIVEPAPDDAAEIAAAEDALAEFYASDIHNRAQFDADGSLDEIVTDGGAHLERMSKKRWFLSMSRADGSSYAVWFKGKITLTEEREPSKHRLVAAAEEALAIAKGEKQPARQFLTGLTAEQLPPGTKTIETEEGILVAETGADPAPEFKTTRRMSDPDIIRAGKRTYDSYAYVQNGSHTEGLNEALRAVLNATRQRIRADLEANVDAAQLAFWEAYDAASSGSVRDQAFAGFRAALRKHSEGV